MVFVRFLAFWCLACCPAMLIADDRPNIVWIVSEDNSIHYLQLYGSALGRTPTIERLAGEGVTFEHAFSNAPVCSVARTTLMTGMFAPRIGFQFHRRYEPAHLPAGAQLFPAYLKQSGYFVTNDAKTDYNVAVKPVWDESSRTASWRHRPTPETPFFHMQTLTVSHESSLHFSAQEMQQRPTQVDPAAVPLPPYYPDTPTFRYTAARYFDRMAAMDRQVAQLVGRLRDDGLLDDTIIFYFGDHGGVLPRSKGYLYETGLHVPLVVWASAKRRGLLGRPPGDRAQGFVSFVDFAPTVLALAGVAPPETMDGRAFLGESVDAREVDARDEAWGYADRFDEKCDFCRSLRKGNYKYIRNYEAFYPDSLHNNYRYKMLAYAQWRSLYAQGQLNVVQRLFFQRKPVEALYDLSADPYEVNNLAAEPSQARRLANLRARLQRQLQQWPDLSFYPESFLAEQALQDGATFGQKHAEQLARLMEVADLGLLPADQAQEPLQRALHAADPWERYGALIVCSCFGKEADTVKLVRAAHELLQDPEPLIRVRAAEFLGLIGRIDPRPTLMEVLRTSKSPIVATLTLNTVVFLRDGEPGYAFTITPDSVRARGDGVTRRLEYLQAASSTRRASE